MHRRSLNYILLGRSHSRSKFKNFLFGKARTKKSASEKYFNLLLGLQNLSHHSPNAGFSMQQQTSFIGSANAFGLCPTF